MDIRAAPLLGREPGRSRGRSRQAGDEVDVTTVPGPWQTVAAADVSYNRSATGSTRRWSWSRRGRLELIERVGVVGQGDVPLRPGPALVPRGPRVLEAFARLKTRPDVVLCDGQGIAHPRRIGLASHLGLWLDLPTIGCAKSLLCGTTTSPDPSAAIAVL